jgi:hypothetical protein
MVKMNDNRCGCRTNRTQDDPECNAPDQPDQKLLFTKMGWRRG